MKSYRTHALVGILFIVVGILWLAMNLDWIYMDEDLLWGIGFLLIGGALILRYSKVDRRIGLLIAGIAVMLVGILVILDTIPAIPDEISGTLFLWTGAAIFLCLHFRDSKYWWAVIPGGVLAVLGTIVIIQGFDLLDDSYTAFIFFTGMSLIFWYLYFYKHANVNLKWAAIVAFVLSCLAVLIILDQLFNDFLGVVFPLALIGIGAGLIFRQRHSIQPGRVDENDKS